MSYVPVNESQLPSTCTSPTGTGCRSLMPTGIAPAPYMLQHLPNAYLPLGADTGTPGELPGWVKLVGVGLALWLFWKLVRKDAARSNPGLKSKLVRISGSARSGWYYKSLRKNARRVGPFATEGDAVDEAEGNGFRVLGG